MTSTNRKPFKNIATLPEVSEEQIYHLRLLKSESSHPDVFYVDSQENVIFFGHYCIIKARYPQLLEGSVKKRRGHYINLAKTKKAISGHTAALEKVIRYVYSGIVEWGQSIGTAVEIVHIAKTYGMIHLLEVNKKFIYENISIENVYQVLSYSHGLGLDEVKKICINFALINASVFFSAKEAKSIDFDLFQELVGILAEHFSEGSRYEFEEPQINESDPIKKHFKSLYTSRDDTGDISIVMGDKSTKAHKCILYGQSKDLDDLIENSESQNNTISIDKQKFPLVNQDSFVEIMKFFYYDFPSLELSSVCRMYKFSIETHLTRLTRTMEHIMATNTMTAKAVPFALEVSLRQLQQNPLAKKLQERTIVFAVKHFTQINFSHLAELDPLIGSVIVQSIQEIVRDYSHQGAEPRYKDIIDKNTVLPPLNDHSHSPHRKGGSDRKKQTRRKSLNSEKKNS